MRDQSEGGLTREDIDNKRKAARALALGGSWFCARSTSGYRNRVCLRKWSVHSDLEHELKFGSEICLKLACDLKPVDDRFCPKEAR